jgi:uncharacterized protein (TIRG00374 family)
LKKALNILKNLIFIGAGIFIFYKVYQGVDIEELKNGLRNANYFYIILALAIAMLGHVSRSYRWKLLIRPIGFNVKTSNAFIATLIMYATNLGVPRSGEVFRPVVMNKLEGVPLSKLIGTIIVERIVDLIMLLSFTFLAIVLDFANIKDQIYHALNLGNSKYGQYITTLNIVIVFLLFAAFIASLFLIKKSQRAFKQHPLYQRIRQTLSGFWTGIKTIWHMKTKWQFILHSLAIWVSYFFMTYLVFFALEPTSHLGIKAGLVVLTISSLGFIMPTPGGIGSYHWAATFALGIYAISKADATTYAFLTHTSQTLMLAIAGGISYIIFMLRRKNVNNEQLTKDKK